MGRDICVLLWAPNLGEVSQFSFYGELMDKDSAKNKGCQHQRSSCRDYDWGSIFSGLRKRLTFWYIYLTSGWHSRSFEASAHFFLENLKFHFSGRSDEIAQSCNLWNDVGLRTSIGYHAVDPPTGFHLLPQDADVLISHHSCVQSVDAAPWKRCGVTGFAFVVHINSARI